MAKESTFKLVVRHATDGGRYCGLQLLAWAIFGGAALLAILAIVLAMEPAR